MRTSGSRQLKLKLGAIEPDPASIWREGAALPFLGGRLRLVLGTCQREAQQAGDALHLPLPPEATPRQIQDRAEAWLRQEASRRLQRVIEQQSALAGRRAPLLALSFAARGHWVEAPDRNSLRCNWRLIEQPIAVIEQAVARAIVALPREVRESDLFETTLAILAN